MRTLDPSEIPKDVLDAATTVSWFFKNRGILAWRLGDIQSREFTARHEMSVDEVNTRQAQLLREAIREEIEEDSDG